MDLVISRLIAATASDAEVWTGNATVTDPAAQPSSDDRLQVTVAWNGTSITCGYMASYTPVAGDVIVFLKAGPSFLVLGKVATL